MTGIITGRSGGTGGDYAGIPKGSYDEPIVCDCPFNRDQSVVLLFNPANISQLKMIVLCTIV